MLFFGGDFLSITPGYYLGYGFTKIPGDVFIPPMCTIQQHRVPYTCLNGRKLGFRKFSREPSTKVPFGWFLRAGDAIKEVRFSPKVIISTICHSYTWLVHGHSHVCSLNLIPSFFHKIESLMSLGHFFLNLLKLAEIFGSSCFVNLHC